MWAHVGPPPSPALIFQPPILVSAPSTMTTNAVSAPGKVLLAGGYLVLDRTHTGLSFGLSARIHVHAAAGHDATGKRVIVRSPQFQNAAWDFDVRDEARLVEVNG